MPSASRKNRERLDKPVTGGLDVLLVGCTQCGAAIGARCTGMFGGRLIVAGGPHNVRLDAYRLEKRLRSALGS